MKNRHDSLKKAVISFLCCIVFFGCSQKKQVVQTSGDQPLPRQQTLYVGGFQWGAPVNFNPLAITPSWPVTGNINLIYEALFGYNLLTGELKPIIGKSYKLTGSILEISLFEQAAWQNGDSLTSEDVVYSFNLHRKYNTNLSFGITNYISEVRTNGRYGVQMTLGGKDYNPLIVYDLISAVQILPKKIFEKLEQDAFDKVSSETGAAPGNADVLNVIREFKNDDHPVGSGPYTLERYSEKEIVLKKIENYWGNVRYDGKAAAPLYIVHTSYENNDKFNNALQQGDLDISATFFPEIWSKFNSGVGTWYKKEPYYIPGIIPALIMGLTKPPISDVNFRRALLHSIDYQKIRNEAVYGYTPELKPGIILPFGSEAKYFSESDAAAFGKLYDPALARKILKNAGYRWGADSMLIDPKGNKIRQLYATCPAGWTDWESTLKIAVAGMRAIGIDVQEKFVEYSQWDMDLKNGLFDFTMKTPHPEQSYSLPWARFDKVMSSKDWRPVGEVMYQNEGRYKSKMADSLLSIIPALTDSVELKKAYGAINRLFLNDVPVIPLMYRPWLFYQFSTKVWHNFPQEENPYAPPQCLMVGSGVEALWGITTQN